MNMRKNHPRGVVALITVLIVMAMLVSIGLTISSVAQNQVVLTGNVQDGETAFGIADACAEDALERLKMSSSFTGTSMAIDGGTCASTAQLISGNTYLVTGQGTYQNHIRVVQINATIKYNGAGNANKVIINSWVEAL